MMNMMPLWGHDLSLLQWGAVIGASLAGAAYDVRGRRIPNHLTFPVLLLGFLWAICLGGWRGGLEALGGCLLLGAPFVVLWLFAGGGAGDAKLMGALGAWLGLVNGLVTLVAVVTAGAVLGLVFALEQGRFRAVMGRMKAMGAGLLLLAPVRGGLRLASGAFPNNSEMLAMPYGISIFSGVCSAAAGVFLWRLSF